MTELEKKITEEVSENTAEDSGQILIPDEKAKKIVAGRNVYTCTRHVWVATGLPNYYICSVCQAQTYIFS